jgi:hypothetical protein
MMMVDCIITFTPSSIANDVLVNPLILSPVGAVISPVGLFQLFATPIV